MKHPPYPRYKPSGVEWLGDVPEHWEVRRSDRFVTTERRQLTPDLFADQEVVHYSIPAVQEIGTGAVEEGESIASAKQVITDRVLLVSKLNPRKATICIAEPADLLTLCSTEFVALHAHDCELDFLYYLALSEMFRQRLDSLVQSVTRSHQRASPDQIYRFWAAWPSRAEQRAIADFLDAQTAKLDTLVAKKRALIEKLKEKRTALISRVVTRGLPPEAARAAGLDPHPKLKPSGVEWLGEVPEGWTVPPIYMRYSIELGKMLNEGRITGEYLVPYLRNVDVQWNCVNLKDLPEMDVAPAEMERYTVSPGDLLVCEGGEVGRAAIVPAVTTTYAYQKALHRLRPHSAGESVRYMYFTLFWVAQQGIFLAEGNPNTIPHLTGEKLRRYHFPRPPFPEQRAIAAYLDRETARIDQLVAKVEEAIERLREYRTALITAAVTGRIDVRGNPV